LIRHAAAILHLVNDARRIWPGGGYDGWTWDGRLLTLHPVGRAAPPPAIDARPGPVTFHLLTQMRSYFDGRVPS
jgi:hypothetical protein